MIHPHALLGPGCEVPDDANIFDLSLDTRRDADLRISFGAQWIDVDAYDSTRLQEMVRHTSADDQFEANKKPDAVALSDCIQAFTKEEVRGAETHVILSLHVWRDACGQYRTRLPCLSYLSLFPR